jgi:hypothetical protein
MNMAWKSFLLFELVTLKLSNSFERKGEKIEILGAFILFISNNGKKGQKSDFTRCVFLAALSFHM